MKNSGHNVGLPHSVPVHLRYFTADFKDEQLVLYKDIYEEDGMLVNNFYPRAESFIKKCQRLTGDSQFVSLIGCKSECFEGVKKNCQRRWGRPYGRKHV